MKVKATWTRREALTLLTAASLKSNFAFAKEMTAREFMSLAIEDIKNNRSKKSDTKMKFVTIPKIVPFVDWDYYYLDGSLLWEPNTGQNFTPVAIHKGFVTDLASVPSGLWSKFPPTGRYAYAAIVHDYLYWFQTTSREEADKILVAAMEDAKVSATTIEIFYGVLRLAGGRAWDSNAKAREGGEKRILAKMPDDPLTSWSDWRKRADVFRS